MLTLIKPIRSRTNVWLTLVSALLTIAALPAFALDNPKKDHALPDGVWEGVLDSDTVDHHNTKHPMSQKVLMAACAGEVRFLLAENDRYSTLGVQYQRHSLPKSHLVYMMDAEGPKPGWVEFHTYALFEINPELVRAQWTRGVNNLEKSETEAGRTYFSHGVIDFKRTATTCDRRFVPDYSLKSGQTR